MFEGFERRDVATRETTIRLRIGGDGPPLLLLHGYPQSHVMWHRVAPVLAAHHTVVCPDLRGYGDSGKPASDASHAAYSKRAMAADMVEVMAALGFERFMAAGQRTSDRCAELRSAIHADMSVMEMTVWVQVRLKSTSDRPTSVTEGLVWAGCHRVDRGVWWNSTSTRGGAVR
jgi:haloacetate dehalogenase